MIHRLVVEVKGGKLLIHPRNEKKWWDNWDGSRGNATVQVTVPTLKAAAIAGSGGIDARGVRSESAEVSIAGSGSVSAQATRTADVSIMGSGDVDLSGGAKCSVSKTGSGNVRCS